MPRKVMDGLGLAWQNVALNGKSWTVLATDAATRLNPTPKPYSKSVLVLLGGQSDLAETSENNSGAIALADMEAYADAARAAGFDTIVACTIPPAAMISSVDDEAQRVIFNQGIRDSTHWEAVADVGVHPLLQNFNDATYYVDTIHWTAAGATVAAGVIKPVLESVL